MAEVRRQKTVPASKGKPTPIKLVSNTPLYDGESNIMFNPTKVIEVMEITPWQKAQIDAGLIKIVQVTNEKNK